MSKKNITRILKIILLVLIVYSAFRLFDRIYNIVILNLVFKGNGNYNSHLLFMMREIRFETFPTTLLMCVFIIVLSTWFFLNYRELGKERPDLLTYKPIWALFAFIVPIFNLFAPYRIMNDLWTFRNRDMSRELWGKRMIKTWWFLSIALFVYWRFINFTFSVLEDGLKSFLSLEYYSLVFFAVMTHYYWLLWRLVRLIGEEEGPGDFRG